MKEFEIYQRHDGVKNKFSDSGLNIDEAHELVKVKMNNDNFNTERINGLNIGDEWAFYNGGYTQTFIKRTK